MFKKIAIIIVALISQPAAASGKYADIVYKVQREVNETIKYKEDPIGKDIWQLPVNGKGDCEDFALLKKKLLIEAGWPEKDLIIAMVWRKEYSNSGHTILIIPSQTAILDMPEPDGSSLNEYPTNYDWYFRKTKNKFFCRQTDESFGGGKKASDRCSSRQAKTMNP